jgi:hypothetical protein
LVELLLPTATNSPEELTVTPGIVTAVIEPFIVAGVVQVVPLVEYAATGAPVLEAPIATNFLEELTATASIVV